MKKVLRDDDGRHDLFWIAQLYDREWKPELEKYSIESVYKMGFPAWLGKGQYGPAQTSGSDSAQDSAFDFGQGYGINAGKGNAVDTGLGSVEVKVEGEFTPT